MKAFKILVSIQIRCTDQNFLAQTIVECFIYVGIVCLKRTLPLNGRSPDPQKQFSCECVRKFITFTFNLDVTLAVEFAMVLGAIVQITEEMIKVCYILDKDDNSSLLNTPLFPIDFS